MDVRQVFLPEEMGCHLKTAKNGKKDNLVRARRSIDRAINLILRNGLEGIFEVTHLDIDKQLDCLIDLIAEATQNAINGDTEYRHRKATEIAAIGSHSGIIYDSSSILIHDACGGYGHVGYGVVRMRGELGFEGVAEIRITDFSVPKSIENATALRRQVVGPYSHQVTVSRLTDDINLADIGKSRDGRRTYLLGKHPCGSASDVLVEKVAKTFRPPQTSLIMPCCYASYLDEDKKFVYNGLDFKDWIMLKKLAHNDSSRSVRDFNPHFRVARRCVDILRAGRASQIGFKGEVRVIEMLPHSISPMNHGIVLEAA